MLFSNGDPSEILGAIEKSRARSWQELQSFFGNTGLTLESFRALTSDAAKLLKDFPSARSLRVGGLVIFRDNLQQIAFMGILFTARVSRATVSLLVIEENWQSRINIRNQEESNVLQAVSVIDNRLVPLENGMLSQLIEPMSQALLEEIERSVPLHASHLFPMEFLPSDARACLSRAARDIHAKSLN